MKEAPPMPKQPAFSGLRHAMKKKQTRRERFLAEMEAVVPWTRLLALIEPHYPKAGPKGGRPPMPLETMLRVYFLQQWYALSDPMAEEMLYDSEAMRRFAGIELGDDRIPDETTILNFRHLLEKHGLTEKLFAEVNGHLADQGIGCARARWSMRRSSTRRPRPRTKPRPAIPRCRRRRRATTGTSA
jgi:IS5 family transposase